MPTPLSGPGVGLPLPQYLFPTELQNAPADASTNKVGLAPGQSWVVPAGTWMVGLNQYLLMQFLDPITGVWTFGAAGAPWSTGMQYIKSDGFNVRLANLTGCPVGAVVTNYGAGGYVQATTTVTATGSTSTWLPIVGGQVGTLSVTNVGAGYGVAPILLIPPPPPASGNPNGVGGVPASGYVTISGGTITGVTLTNPGAGYPSAPTAVLVTNPFDPNISTGITQGAVTFSVVGSGSLTAVLCTNNGAPITPANITLTVAGAGTQATCVANVLQTITAGSVTGQGLGYGTLGALLTTTGGGGNRGTITNSPEFLGLYFRPRPADINLTVTAAGSLTTQLGTILDGGLFLSAPNPVVGIGALAGATGSITGATLALTMGSVADIATVQPAP